MSAPGVADGTGARPRAPRGLIVFGALGALWLGAFLVFARLGFNPTDDGFIVSQSSALLHGLAPHAGISSPRPLGSPLLHTVDVLLPTPLLLTTRAIALLEFVVIAALGVRLVTRRPLRSWGGPELSLTAIAFLVNLHEYPIMSWHTVDGLLVVLASLVVLEAGVQKQRLPLIAAGAVLIGCAPLIKQSFAPAPFLAIAWVVWLERSIGRERRALRPSRLVAAMAPMVVPGLAYGLWLVATSATDAAREQLLSADSVDLDTSLSLSRIAVPLALALALVTVATIVAGRVARSRSGEPEGTGLAAEQALAALVAISVAAVAWMFGGHLQLAGSWGEGIWWLAAAAAGIDGIARRRADDATLALLAVAWMASLSWGYNVPNLLAGSLLVTILVTTYRTAQATLPQERAAGLRKPGLIAVAVLLVATIGLSVVERREAIYRDRPASELTADLGAITPAGWGIVTNPTTARYLTEVGDCLEQYPASRLAVLPDNPVVPLLFDRRNPFALVWWYPLEFPADHDLLLDDVRSVSREGDYLVLFQSVSVDHLADADLEPANAGTERFDHKKGLVDEVAENLDGTPVTCGSFTGIYQPAA